MFTSFRVKNYRCFKDLTVEPLERVNLIAGKNNVGKSALLEALWLFHRYDAPSEVVMVTRRRGIRGLSPREYLESAVRGFDLSSSIEIEASESTDSKHLFSIKISGTSELVIRDIAGSSEGSDGEERYEIVYEYQPPSGKKSVYRAFVDPDGTITQTRGGHSDFRTGSLLLARQADDPNWAPERLSELMVRKEKTLLIDALRLIAPLLEEVSIIFRGKSPLIYAGIQGHRKLMPIALLGDGLMRLTSIFLGITSASNGLLLIDEIENGLHYSVMTKVWKAIGAAARTFDVQVFATTHSDECIRAAFNAFSEDDVFDSRFHRLDNIEGNISSVTYDRETLEFALENGWEVR